MLSDLLEQLEDALRDLVRLGKHSLSRLDQDVVLGVGHHLFRYVGIADAGLCILDVLLHDGEVVCGVLQTVLGSAQVAADTRNSVD